jgi:arginyl-tRNA synthetase
MQLFINNLKNELYPYLQTLVEGDISQVALHFELTNPEHQGNLTLLVFPLAKMAKKNPEEMAQLLGQWMVENNYASSYDVIKGFLNINLSAQSWQEINSNLLQIEKVARPDIIVLEYCGPNTNKPLHIGHLRNLFLGFSMGRILQEAGHSVHKVNINNDRGIAICKSLIAYQLYGNGATPESVGKKGDHFVGDFYVKFAEVLKVQIEEGIAKGLDKKTAEKQASITQANEDLLRKWENGDIETIALWQKMNDWVYQGFRATFDDLEIDFEKEYYESQEYLN